MIDRVGLAEVPHAERNVLANLLQLYLHDFSAFAVIGTPYGEVGPEGRFPYDWLDSYWQEEARVPLFISADGRLAGFILVNQYSALGQSLDRSVAEFFILRKYRRAKVGTRGAMDLFSRYPGQWEVPVADYNQPALTFWRKILPAAAADEVKAHAGDGNRWSGTVFCFRSVPPVISDNAAIPSTAAEKRS